MRRVLAYFEWDAKRWRLLADNPPVIGNCNDTQLPAVQQLVNKEKLCLISGKKAYALRQAEVRDRLREHCRLGWEGLANSLLSMKNGSAKIMVEGDDVLDNN